MLHLWSLNSAEHINIAFSSESLVFLNICLAVIMFGIALGIQPGDFKLIYRSPWSIVTGIFSQFILLPAATFIIIWIWRPDAALALGMILVAACPGGNVSNFIASISNANIALSVSLTAFATLLCPIFTPLNFGFWAGLLPETSALLQQFEISFTDMLSTVSLLLILPLATGMLMRRYAAALSAKIEKPVRWISIFILIGFIAMALKNNFDTFKTHLYLVFVLVVLHNATAFALGYLSGKLMHLPESDRRSVCIETGIQNSGLGLIIIFTFFDGNGGMALIAAWWGVWHIVSGLILSQFFKKASRPLKII